MTQVKDQMMCPHFVVGKCFYGNNCKFKHPGQMGPPSPYFALNQMYDPSMMISMGYNPMLMMGMTPNIGIFFAFSHDVGERRC
jgi:hypothetical protein